MVCTLIQKVCFAKLSFKFGYLKGVSAPRKTVTSIVENFILPIYYVQFVEPTCHVLEWTNLLKVDLLL